MAKDRPAAVRRGLRGTAWLAFLAVGAAMTVAYFLLGSPEAQDLAYQAPGMLAALAVLAGIALHRPADARPWIALATGLALTAAGDWTWVILDRVYGIEPFPSVADIFYLSGMGVTVGAVLWLVRGRVPGGDRAGMLDALIVAVGVGLVSWIFFIEPIVADPELSIVEIAMALAYPVLDLLLLSVLVRLFLAPGRRVPALELLIGGFVFFLASDFPYAFLALTDAYAVGQPVDAGWLIGSVLWGASALHPSMRHIAEPVEASEIKFSAWRVLLLAGASLTAPALLVIQWWSGEPIDVPVIAGGCVVLYLLVIARLAGVVTDLRDTLQERRALEEELEQRAMHDPLTGLANRTLFADRLDQALRVRGGKAAVLFLDLDDFKTINDAYGHEAGDSVLRTVATALKASMRPEDTVARLGGDEFAVLLASQTDDYAAGLVAERLLVAARTPAMVAGSEHVIGASIGVSLGTAGLTSGEQLMREADIAMYVAKSKGKGAFTIFEPTTHQSALRGVELRADLEQAIREQQFVLHYQPIVELEHGEVVGVEALVRWNHPIRGLLEPTDFIPLAEATGAIVPLGEWIARDAIGQAARWAAADPPGPTAGGRYVAVNLSAVQISRPGFASVIADALAESGLDPRQLVLEVTESTRLDQAVALQTLRDLRALGLRLAIDDFGTGWASLSHLSHHPFDMVKIDQTFIRSIWADPRAESLVTGVVDLARRLNVVVVAEGVEDAHQLSRLRLLGVGLGQGFHFARPMPPRDLEQLLAAPAGTKGGAAAGAAASAARTRRSSIPATH